MLYLTFIFVGWNRKSSIFQKKKKKNLNFQIIGNFPCWMTKMDTEFLDSAGQKINSSIYSIRKILEIPKYQNWYFRMSYNYHNSKKIKNVQNNSFAIFYINVVYFDEQNSNPKFIFVSCDKKTSIIL